MSFLPFFPFVVLILPLEERLDEGPMDISLDDNVAGEASRLIFSCTLESYKNKYVLCCKLMAG